MNEFRFYSDAEEGEPGFFDGQCIDADCEAQAWQELKSMLTEKEFSSAELL